jgi:hypothetical protein
VTKGYALVYLDNIPRYVDADNTGSFETYTLICPGIAPSCEILGVDKIAQKQGIVTSVNIIAPETNVGDISTCGSSSEQYVNYTLDGKDLSLTSSANDSLFGYTSQWPGSSETVIVATNNATGYIYFESTHNNSAGTFPVTRFGTQNLRDSSIVLLQPSTIIFTNNPQTPGEFYEGSLSVKFTDQQVTGSDIHNVSGTFRIRRQQ